MTQHDDERVREDVRRRRGRMLVDDPSAKEDRYALNGMLLPAGKREETDAELRKRLISRFESRR